MQSPRLEPSLFQNHSNLVRIDPAASIWIDYHDATRNLRSPESDQNLTHRGIDSPHFDNTDFRHIENREQWPQTLRVTQGSQEGEDGSFAVPFFFENVGFDIANIV